MQVVDCDQGDSVWLQSRCGVCTASMFQECRKIVGGLDERQTNFVELVKAGKDRKYAATDAGYKNPPRSEIIERAIKGEVVGDFSETAKKYAFRLAVERISGELLSEDKFETWEMRRGHELEPEARLLHEEKKCVLVRRVGFAMTDDKRFGCSLDGEIGGDGISEYKCFVSPSSLMPILLNNDIDSVKDQIMGGLWITGRKWAHFCLYCPALRSIGKEIKIIEMERDDEYIHDLEQDLLKFDELVTKYEQQLRG